MTILKTIIPSIIFTIGFFFQPNGIAIAGEDMGYEQRLRLVNEAKDILIKRNICTDRERDCRDKELILSARSFTGNLFEFYEIGTDATKEIVELCLKEYEKSNRKITMTVVFYKEPHKERVGKFLKASTPKPYIEINLKGEQ